MPSNTDCDSISRRVYCRFLFALFVGQWLLVLVKFWLGPFGSGNGAWPEIVLLILGASATLVGLSQELPWQNVLMVSGIIVVLTSIAQRAGKSLGIEFGPITALDGLWAAPLVWLVAIVNARGAAQMALFRWRNSAFYGLWLLGIASLLVGLFGLGFEFYVPSAAASWVSQSVQSKLPIDATAALNVVCCWSIVAGLSILLATPSFINKSPVERPAPHQPLITWFLLNLLGAMAAFVEGSWLAASIVVIGNMAIFISGFWKLPHARQMKGVA